MRLRLGSSSAVPIQSLRWLLELCYWDWKNRRFLEFSNFSMKIERNLKIHVEVQFPPSWIFCCHSFTKDFCEEVFISMLPIQDPLQLCMHSVTGRLHPPRLKIFTKLPITPLHQDGWGYRIELPVSHEWIFDVSTKLTICCSFVVMETNWIG